MEIYKSETGEVFVVLEKDECKSQEEAKTIANKHFKTRKDRLEASVAVVVDDVLHFDKKKGRKVIAVWTRKVGEV